MGALPKLDPVHSLAGLQPRPVQPQCSRDEALMILDLDLRLVGALCELAIAEGWDSGRLSFPNESKLPFETEVKGILGRSRGAAREQLRQAESAVGRMGAAYGSLQLGDRQTPLATLSAELSLSALAAKIISIVAAPAFWGELARLYGIVANDPGRPLCDELLVGQILGRRASRHQITLELDRLESLGVVHAEGKARPFVALTVDPVVLARLRGEDFGGDGVAVVRRSDVSLEDLVIPESVKAAVVAALGSVQQPARVVVRGRLGSGRRSLLAALGALANRDLGVLNAALLPREPQAFVRLLRQDLQRAWLRGWLPCVSGLEQAVGEDPTLRAAAAELFRTHPGPLTFRFPPETNPSIDPGYIACDLPVLNETDRREVWRAAAARRGFVGVDSESLAARYRIGPGIIEQVTRKAFSAELIIPAIRQHVDVRIGDVAQRVSRLATWESAVFPADVMDSIREFIGRVRHRRTVFEDWGFDATMSTSRGLTALFQGGPGTGKSMVAGIIARELGLDLYRIDLSRVMSKWIGETERNLGSVFDAAEDGQAILLFDEADALFAKRTEVKSSNDRYANNTVNYLLQRLDSFDGIAILTTNLGGTIDAAVKRRLSLRLTIPFPDEEMREKLWAAHLPARLPVSGAFDIAALARKYQLSGGYIRNAALRAAFLAAQEAVSMTQHHLERAVKAEFREIGKLADTGVLE